MTTKTIACALLVFTTVTAVAQTEKTLRSTISTVTVYNDRALVTRIANENFAVGRYSIKVPGLPQLLNDQSVRISGKGSATAKILEVRVETAMLDSVPNARVKELQGKLKNANDAMRKIEDRAKVLLQQREFLVKMAQGSAESISRDLPVQRPSIDDWRKLLAFIDESHSRLSAEQRELDAKKEELQKQIAAIEFDLKYAGASQERREKQVIVAMEVAAAGKLDIGVSYLVRNASWQPIYDLRAATKEKRIELTYNALVWQETGEDWNDVRLILSTSQPVVGGSEPSISTWFLDAYGGTKGAIQGFVRDVATGEPLAGANISIRGTSQGAATNADGFFNILNVPPGDYSLRVTLIGYRTTLLQAQVVPYQTTRLDALLDAENVTLEAITIEAEQPIVNKSFTGTIRGGRASDVRLEEVGFQTAVVQRGATSVAYEIASKATVLSNNTKRKVTITIASMDGEFSYSSAPKLQPHVYFTANVTNSTDFSLLGGSVSVFVDDNYISNSRMPTVLPGENFDAFLGVDDAIKIERKVLNKLTETTGFFSKSRRTTYDILITIENMKKSNESVTIKENVPISRNEAIKVMIETPASSEVQPDAEGILRWHLNVKAGEKKEVRLKFSIEYPTDMTISALE